MHIMQYSKGWGFVWAATVLGKKSAAGPVTTSVLIVALYVSWKASASSGSFVTLTDFTRFS